MLDERTQLEHRASAMACPSTCRSQAATRRLLKGGIQSHHFFRKRIVQESGHRQRMDLRIRERREFLLDALAPVWMHLHRQQQAGGHHAGHAGNGDQLHGDQVGDLVQADALAQAQQ
jgi:hypothetical protein